MLHSLVAPKGVADMFYIFGFSGLVSIVFQRLYFQSMYNLLRCLNIFSWRLLPILPHVPSISKWGGPSRGIRSLGVMGEGPGNLRFVASSSSQRRRRAQKMAEQYFSRKCPKSISLDSGHLDKPFGPLISKLSQYFRHFFRPMFWVNFMENLPFHPHYDVWALIVSLVIFFELSTKDKTIKKDKRRLWYSGLLILWAFTDYPIHDIGERYLKKTHKCLKWL